MVNSNKFSALKSIMLFIPNSKKPKKPKPENKIWSYELNKFIDDP